MSKNEIMIEAVKEFVQLPPDARQFVLGYMVAIENGPAKRCEKPEEKKDGVRSEKKWKD